MTLPDVDFSPSPATSRKPAQILKAAHDVFREQGYSAASMDAIAREAGVSKATLYAHFASKEDLFAAVTSEACRAQFNRLAEPAALEGDIREVLTEVGGKLLRFLLSPKVNKVYRNVVAEAARFPDLGRILYQSGPGQGRGDLARFLAAATARGELTVTDPELAAEQFSGLILGHMKLRLELGFEVPDEDVIERHLRSGIDVFLRAYSTRPR